MPAEQCSSINLSNTAPLRHRNPLPARPANPCCHHKVRRPDLGPAGRGDLQIPSLPLKKADSMPQRQIGGVKLTPGQYEELVQMAGKPAKTLLSQLVASPGFASLPDYAKQRTVREIFNRTREVAREALLAKYPDLLRQSLVRKRDLVMAR